MKIISGKEVKKVLDSIPTHKLIDAVANAPKIEEKISQIDIDETGSTRVVCHLGALNKKYYCKYAVSIPTNDIRAKISLMVSDKDGDPIALLNSAWISHYRTALLGAYTVMDYKHIDTAFIIGRGPIGSSINKFLSEVNVKCTMVGRGFSFEKSDAIFVAITEDNIEPLWGLRELYKYSKIICDFTRHSVDFRGNLELKKLSKDKDTTLLSSDGAYFRFTGSIKYDIALLDFVLENAKYVNIDFK